MQFAILIIASILIVCWLMLLSRTTKKDWALALSAKIFDNKTNINKLCKKDKLIGEKLSGYKNLPPFVLRILLSVSGGNSQNKIKKLERDTTQLQNGNRKSLNVLLLPGYVLQREFETIGKGNIHKIIVTKCLELYGRKYATEKTKQVLAKLISYPLLGLACIFALGAIFISVADVSIGLIVIGLGASIIFVLSYAIFDELAGSVMKRRIAISKQFPNVVSKLALLVTSGMIMDRAWKQTAFSKESELYQEMRMTSEELDNLVSPEAAYGNFINRCNTKESAKLATAIMQNLSKGNAEIGRLLKDMAREAWQERRHTAKRDAEKANSRLMIPTMLLFLAILIMLMVPIAMSFSGI